MENKQKRGRKSTGVKTEKLGFFMETEKCDKLREVSKETGVPISEIIRRAVSVVIDEKAQGGSGNESGS